MITVTDVTVISVSAVGVNLITSALPSNSRNTIRIIEIVGGLMMAQLAKKPNIKAGGAGIMTGALVGFVNDLLGLNRTEENVKTEKNVISTIGNIYMKMPDYSYYDDTLVLPSDYCASCQKNKMII